MFYTALACGGGNWVEEGKETRRISRFLQRAKATDRRNNIDYMDDAKELQMLQAVHTSLAGVYRMVDALRKSAYISL